jgi:hypothetical protein
VRNAFRFIDSLIQVFQVCPSPSEAYDAGLEICNYIFAVFFNIEAILKLATFRRAYFLEYWNVFDCTCVVATDAGVVTDRILGLNVGAVMSAVKLFRIARLFRLVRFMSWPDLSSKWFFPLQSWPDLSSRWRY